MRAKFFVVAVVSLGFAGCSQETGPGRSSPLGSAVPPASCEGEEPKSYQELKDCGNKEGRDYTITALDRKSEVLVMAIHGGKIEAGTSELANLTAGNDASLYKFEGRKSSNNHKSLHITSTLFDEPRLHRMLPKANICISIHGFKGDGSKDICVGGKNDKLRRQFLSGFEENKEKLAGFSAVDAIAAKDGLCQEWRGDSDKNVVNQCKSYGIQLEMSHAARESILGDMDKRRALAEILRSIAELPPLP